MSRAKVSVPPLVAAELARRPCVDWWTEKGGKHDKLRLRVRGAEGFLALTSTPSCKRSRANEVRDLRRVIRILEEKSERLPNP